MKALLIVISLFLCMSCIQQQPVTIIEYEEPDREWTFIVYMAADNDLEAHALRNMNQLEGVNYEDSAISVLTLIDRADGHDQTDGNWTDTRVYEVQTDMYGVDTTIRSNRLSVPQLGLKSDENTELDTGDYRTLQNMINFAKENYPANNYALIMWGHGSGWRSSSSTQNRAMGFDDNSTNFITNVELQKAVEGLGINLVAFDTCFGGLLEIGYELKNDVDYMIGSAGLSPATGWDYEAVFNDFLSGEKTIENFSNAVVSNYKSMYSSVPNASIAAMDLSKINNVKRSLDTFAQTLADSITNENERTIVKDILLKYVDTYHETTFPCDLFLDVYDMSEKVKNKVATITSDKAKQISIENASENLQTQLEDCIPISWKEGLETSYVMSVHLIPLTEGSVPYTEHGPAYIKGSDDVTQTAFVKDSNGWAPNKPIGISLLDKLFYYTFP